MKKSVIAILSLTLLFMVVITGCSSSDKPENADKDFIESMADGLEARWDLNDKDGDKETTLKMMQSYIQAELDEIQEYEKATFKDSKLQEKALKYINILKDSYKHADYCLSDNNYDKWQKFIDDRSVLIKDFVENYDLKVDSDHQATLDEFVSEGNAISEKSEQEDEINALVNSLKFKLAKNDYGYKTYEAVFKNTSDYTIKSLSLDINLLDKSGTIIDTQYGDTKNVKKGQKAKIEFSTDKSFKKIDPAVSYFEVE